jgi:tetratricopeptide (TPR) repeat protein
LSIQIDPSFINAYIGRGEILINLKRFQEAISNFNAVLLMQPDMIVALFLLGVTYVEMADYQENKQFYSNALECFNNVLKIEPDHIDSLANCAYISARLGNFEKFEKDFNHLVKNYPDDHDIIFQYLDVCIKKLNYSKSTNDIIGKVV